jgi:hypothetical protein
LEGPIDTSPVAVAFRNFALIAAAFSGINWVVAERRMNARLPAASSVATDLPRRIVRIIYGELTAFFLIVALIQWKGGHSDPLFPFYERTSTVGSQLVWVLAFALWIINLFWLWRPGVAEAAVQAGFLGRPDMSARTFRLIVSAIMVVDLIFFAALLAGVWGPVTRPTLH